MFASYSDKERNSVLLEDVFLGRRDITSEWWFGERLWAPLKESGDRVEETQKEIASANRELENYERILAREFPQAEQKKKLEERQEELLKVFTQPQQPNANGTVAMNMGVTPQDIWNSLPQKWRDTILKNLPQQSVKNFVLDTQDAIRNFAYEGLSGTQRLYPSSADSIIKWGASNTISDIQLMYASPKVLEHLRRRSTSGSTPLWYRIGLRMSGRCFLQRSRLSKRKRQVSKRALHKRNGSTHSLRTR